jgi:hypothetical protein
MCRACRVTYEGCRDRSALPEAEAVCRRVRSKVTPWYLRTPGYFYTEELPRLLSRNNAPWATPAVLGLDRSGSPIRSAPRALWAPVVPVPCMTPAQLRAELARQVKRLAGHSMEEP